MSFVSALLQLISLNLLVVLGVGGGVEFRLAGQLYFTSVEITNKMQLCNRIYYSNVY